MKLSKKQFKQDFEERLTSKFATDLTKAGYREIYDALASVVKHYYANIWVADNQYKDETGKKQAYYFSIEFLPGKMLKSNLLNLGILNTVREGLNDFGIELDENFTRPFFSTSITDFWHRWHITLGTWMKDYVFYPLTLSKWMGKFRKAAKKKMGKKIAVKLPICVANLIVFFLVGVWHGAAWKYIAYGMFNGIIIAFSGMMGDQYKKWKKSLHITGKENWYHVFMILRTFILVNISWFFDCSDTVGQAVKMMKYAVTSFEPTQLFLIPAGREGVAFTPYALMILLGGCIVLFIVSVLQERGIKIREKISERSFAVQFILYAGLLLSIGFFGSTAAVRGFIYAQF